MKFIKGTLDKAVSVYDSSPDPVPETLSGPLHDYMGMVEQWHTRLTNPIESYGDTSQYFSTLTTTFSLIDTQHAQLFEPSSSNKFLNVCNAFATLLSNNYDKVTSILKNEQKRIAEDTKKLEILKSEIEKQASEKVATNYAQIFFTQENKHRNNSYGWLAAIIVFSSAALLLLFYSFENDIFQITFKKPDGTLSFNYPNALSKLIIISLLLYLTSFSVKQYAVNKNLQSINCHRKNALNSFLLFRESIESSDAATKNTLILHVAKSIYEHVGTGYLPTQETNSPSIIELTKYVSPSSNT
jgi:hypothetical protein